jgi:hypothetical protein
MGWALLFNCCFPPCFLGIIVTMVIIPWIGEGAGVPFTGLPMPGILELWETHAGCLGDYAADSRWMRDWS